MEGSSQDLHHWRFLKSFKNDLNAREIKAEQLEGRILFMSMFNDIDGTRKGNSSDCVSISEKVRDYAKRFPRGHWSFRGLEEKNKWNGTHTYKPEGKWNEVARKRTSDIPSYWSSQPVRTTHSANQLSIYGAVSSWCEDLAEQMFGLTYGVKI